MRPVLVLAFSLFAAGAAHAQIQPITPPKNPYALPQPPSAASVSSGFTPYKPPAYLNPAVQPTAADPYPHMRHAPGVITPRAATPSDPYPEMRRKHRAADNHF